MTVTNDIEKDTKANFAVAEVVDNSASATPTLTEASIYGNESAMAKTATVVTVERSPLELATAVDTEESDKRKADLCCGSCCDYLRACVIVNIVTIVYNGLGIFLYIIGVSFLNSAVNSDDIVFDDDEVEAMVDQVNDMFVIAFVLAGLSLLFAIIGIVGAAKYNKAVVLATGVYYIIDVFLVAILQQDFTGAVMMLFFAYPHIGLFLAIKRGHITKETYERERYCCCDGSPR
mmetsp:Transcript_1133/g.2507  ORF Transcript_1133/g.2507 Transcript_1133/m.2507 type:complete len:233 (-) Transcript_1133:328-1026(-)|eukprot:CAMPEP_0116136712 /NCGR_PEP_ID=MMETSP0329-20121206/11873_1 /TAXON_ID=697910 /ORGANISM="Pseudo-nitzschia arenysensis, Strain B593" /LENGTH=232 /DNA_ID=CAMNT_0003631603 /DNA_START=92 /DNA_END=790 /DNA_ORIENTATION=+